MTTRTMGPAAGWRWLMTAVNLGGGNPRAIFGGAALVLLLVFVTAVVLSLASALAGPATAGGQMLLSVVVSVPLLVLMAGLLVGYLRLVDNVENGRPATATLVLAGFSDRAAWMRSVVLLLVLALLQYVLIAGTVMLVAPEVADWYVANLGAPEPTATLPPGFGRAFALTMVVSVLLYAAQALGLGQVALRGHGVGQALADGATGAIRNVLPLVLLLLVGLVAMFVIALVVAVLAMVFAALGGGSGAGMVVGMVIGVPVYLLLLLAMIVVSVGVMYAMWRDICGEPGAAPPHGDDHVAA